MTENTLYFRVDEHNRVTFQEAEAFPPLNYAKKGHTIDLSFWRVPERVFDEPDELVAWARAALAAARRVAGNHRPLARLWFLSLGRQSKFGHDGLERETSCSNYACWAGPVV